VRWSAAFACRAETTPSPEVHRLAAAAPVLRVLAATEFGENGAVTTYQHLLVETSGPITTVTLDRPEKRNTLALDVLVELTDAFREVGESEALGVVLAASGPVFSAGHNFADMAGTSLAQARRLLEVCADMMETVQQIPQPVVARVHALATAAGCQLVATCDLAVAAESAAFALLVARAASSVTRRSSPLLATSGASAHSRWRSRAIPSPLPRRPTGA
jgi:1,4-dihydroxy-2-naphthoyl-CoA synthase